MSVEAPRAAPLSGEDAAAMAPLFRADGLALVAACERRIVNAWPAPRTLLLGDWVARFASGYSTRANSATPIRASADLDDDEIAWIEAAYGEAGLPPCIRVTPLAAPTLGARLISAGWRPFDTSVGMIGPEPSAAVVGERDADVEIETRASRAWIEGVSAWAEGAKRDPAKLAAIVGNIALPAAFATLRDAGGAVAYALAVEERGLAEIGSVVVAPHARGRGLGRRLMLALTAWTRGRGARAYLQVLATNAPARRLYASLGFSDLYAYTALSKGAGFEGGSAALAPRPATSAPATTSPVATKSAGPAVA